MLILYRRYKLQFSCINDRNNTEYIKYVATICDTASPIIM